MPNLRHALLLQAGHLFPWAPVMMGCGIAIFFALRFEPDRLIWAVSVMACLLMPAVVWARGGWRYGAIALLLTSVGFLQAAWRTHAVAEPVLGFRYYGPVEGRIIAIDRSASDAVRLTLDRVVLYDMAPDRTPARVRISLHGDQSHFAPRVGETVMMAAHVSGPNGPVEPGGFDFQRHAWFLQLGGVGYTRSPAMVLAAADQAMPIQRWRQSVGAAVQRILGPERGGFATALITGDRSGIAQEQLDQLRDTNLAHLLAISGMHMGMLSAVVFGAVRGGFALVPAWSMRLPVKQIAAFVALCAATIYLLISGGAIATERAYIMVAVALTAVLLRQRAISLRAVAVAALIVLSLTPEALLSPGFQMSFAATTALVAVFGWLRGSPLTQGPKWLRPVVALVISSAVAGVATAPFGAAHFNQMSQWGLLANLLSVPVMGAVVMPGIVAAAVLAPVGGAWLGLEVAGLGLSWILWVAEWVSGFPSAVRYVSAPSAVVLPLIAGGGLIVAFAQSWLRFAGLPVAFLGLMFWTMAERPFLLISDNGGLVGVMTDSGRALSRARGSGFVAQVWLENDGDGRAQAAAADAWGQAGLPMIHHVTGRKTAAEFSDCREGDLLVTNARVPPDLPCQVIDPIVLRQTGSIAIGVDGAMKTARQVHGARIWNPWGREDR